MKIYAFADEASANIDEQIKAMKENKLDGLEIRNVDGVNISRITKEKAKEVRKKLGIYKDKYRVYRIELRGTDRIIDFMDIIKETCR